MGESNRNHLSTLIYGIALVLLLALALFGLGWSCAQRSNGVVTEAAKDVKECVIQESIAVQQKVDARLDGVEHKLDILLNIATNSAARGM